MANDDISPPDTPQTRKDLYRKWVEEALDRDPGINNTEMDYELQKQSTAYWGRSSIRFDNTLYGVVRKEKGIQIVQAGRVRRVFVNAKLVKETTIPLKPKELAPDSFFTAPPPPPLYPWMTPDFVSALELFRAEMAKINMETATVTATNVKFRILVVQEGEL